jgi:hypothetical protein
MTSQSKRWLPAVLILLAFLGATPAFAHLGSPDIYAEGDAGPYRLFVTLRPPNVIPGVAEIEVRTDARDIDWIQVAPMPLTGEASKHPPVPDRIQRSSADPNFYTGNLWIMASGSWQVRFAVRGRRGQGELSIPVAATPTTTLKMQPALGAGLGVLGIFLVLGMVGIIGASVREAQLPPGAIAPPARRRRARIAMGVGLAVMLLAVWLGGKWWNADAASYADRIYQPLVMQATLKHGDIVKLSLSNPSGLGGWMRSRKDDDFILDHDHLMHLYMIREPQMDVLFHLHPQLEEGDTFKLTLPSMPPGSYRLYADVVHADGFPETLVSNLTLPAIDGRPLSGDDASGIAPPLDQANDAESSFHLADGYTMVWARPPVLKARRPLRFEFYLLDPQGKAPNDMNLYMGMLGHAAFVKDDGTVFAHIHPSGTPSMAAMNMAQQRNSGPQPMSMPMGDAVSGALPNHVGFPYGFPTPGKYRIFVQMRHGNTIETGSFDAAVAP